MPSFAQMGTLGQLLAFDENKGRTIDVHFGMRPRVLLLPCVPPRLPAGQLLQPRFSQPTGRN
ncbi:protein of unknown function [Burkholderia multivorans]